MQENFTITIPSFSPSLLMKQIIFSLIISFIIVYPITGFTTTTSIFVLLILTFIIYLLISNMGINKADNVPFSTYPAPPHTGLDGISLDNLVAGIPVSQYV